MFTVEQVGSKLQLLYRGNALLTGIIPTTRTLDDDALLVLQEFRSEPAGNAEREEVSYCACYRTADETIALDIRLQCSQTTVLVSVDYRLKHDMFGQSYALPAEDAISLSFDEQPSGGQFMAIYSHLKWWTRPYFASSLGELPDQTHSLLWKEDQTYYYLQSLCDGDWKAMLGGKHGNGAELRLSSYREGFREGTIAAFVLGAGANPYELSSQTIQAGMNAIAAPSRPRETKEYPEFLDYLGWCTWDAFYHDVNERGILDKAEEFHTAGLPVKWLIVDDGWSITEERYLVSFKENKEKFPAGLQQLFGQLKETFGFQWTGVWHAFTGYWNGIKPGSELALQMSEYLLHTASNHCIPHPDPVKGFGFWRQWHAMLKAAGVDFIKVDSQSSLLPFIRGNLPLGQAARGAHEALEASAALHFQGRVINCMGMAPENVWNRPMTAVSRNSDDFYPKKEKSFKEHAVQNVYNSVWHSQFYYGDWDMWWSDHPDALNNAVLRAVSGGPIYISDRPGATNVSQIWPLMMRDGRILRCDGQGLPTEDCLLSDPQREKLPLKVWNKSGNVHYIAAFHVHQEAGEIAGQLSPSDITDVEGDSFIVYDAFSRTAVLCGRTEKIRIVVEEGKPGLYAIVPLEDSFAAIGLIDKYISSAAIVSEREVDGVKRIRLRQGGLFGFISRLAPARAVVNGQTAAIHQSSEMVYFVDSAEEDGEVDIEIRL